MSTIQAVAAEQHVNGTATAAGSFGPAVAPAQHHQSPPGTPPSSSDADRAAGGSASAGGGGSSGGGPPQDNGKDIEEEEEGDLEGESGMEEAEVEEEHLHEFLAKNLFTSRSEGT